MEPKSKFGKIPGSVYRDMKLSTRSINELNGRRPGLFITNSREWDVEKIRAICPFAEENILKIKASSTGAPDKLCWMGTKNGEYTTKSGYHAAELEATGNWNQEVLNLQTAPKVKMLIWKALGGTLPVGTNLQERHIPMQVLR